MVQSKERKGPCLYVCTEGSRRACGVGACPRLLPTKSDPRETSGPRIDRIPPTRPPWWRRQFRELKKLIFSAPSKCPIDFCGPLGNRMILKQSLLTGGLRKSAARRRRDRRDYWMAQVGAGSVDADSFSISALSERRSRAPFLAVAGRPGPRPRASAALFVPPWRRRPPPRAPRPRPAPRP